MSKYKVGYIVGSLAKGSINRQLAHALAKLAAPQLELVEIPIGDLPLYSYDYDADFPAVARAFKQAIAEVDAVLFVTPEYNRSIPGALKNAIDWASRPWGKNSFARKPSAVIGTSPGRDRHLARLDRHRGRPATTARRAVLLQLAADEHDGGVPPVQAGPDRRGRQRHQPVHRRVPDQLHEGAARVHRTRAHRAAAGKLTPARRRAPRRPLSYRLDASLRASSTSGTPADACWRGTWSLPSSSPRCRRR